ncbi:MAG: hypothetical protein ABR517_13610 [Thermoanaerobaculia bacterium]
MNSESIFQLQGIGGVLLLAFAAILLLILIISFRSRAVVFCQYLEAMTGVRLRPAEVRRRFRASGKAGVREMFLDLMIREDLKDGPIEIPETAEPASQP